MWIPLSLFLKYLCLGCLLLLTACGEVTPSKVKKAVDALAADSHATELSDKPVAEAADDLWGNWNFAGALAQFPGAYPVDEPEDLRVYFESLLQRGAQIWVNQGECDSLYVWDAIDEMNRYVKGYRKYFPEEEVEQAIALMNAGAEQKQQDMVCLEADRVYPGEAFMFRFMEQAARLATQIDALTHHRASDGRVGIYCQKYRCNPPLYTFLVYKQEDHYKIEFIGKKEGSELDRIYLLKDDKERTYYLCSNHDSLLSFAQYLYVAVDDTIRPVCSTENFYEANLPDDAQIVFMPQHRCWKFCQKDGNIYRKIPGTRTLYLILNGEASHFRLQ